MSPVIDDLIARDIRFPTSRTLEGSDAVNPDPDYSAVYVTLRAADLEGHGLTFTIGRGNEICRAAVAALRPLVMGRDVADIRADMAGFWHAVTADSQLRWIGPEKGAIHLAVAAIVNAVWDLLAREQGKPLWKLLVDMTPDEVVAGIDFSYIEDALSPDEARDLLSVDGRDARERHILAHGFPAYTTSAGWLGFSDDKLRTLCRQARAEGWTRFKLKVGADIEEDLRRLAIMRDEIGMKSRLMVDANQNWRVDEAIENIGRLSAFDLWWVEEPTHPDDILGHARIAEAVAPVPIATGEQCPNRVLFKQFFQARAMDVCQLDVCRLGGISEALAVVLMARKFGVPVCPHGGGVGLCEYIQHIAIFDYIALGGDLDDRVLEYVDHLHEHFVHPVAIRNGAYCAPQAPGTGIEMHAAALDRYAFPEGEVWCTSP